MFTAGHQLGQYRILSALGAGGMGEVYLAEDTRLRRRVALKVLPAAGTEDELSRKRLLREAQAAATLDHANICTVFDIGEADGRSFIVMQYVEGQTLAAKLKRSPLDLASAVGIATQVAAALAEAHRHGVIHRDIKPQNIMLTPGGQVKVLDFGLAKLTSPIEHDAHTATLLTEAGTVAGTVPYMSPEQIRGEPLDARSDVFSFGCVLYEMIGRAGPFECGNAADTMSAVLTREPPPLSDATAPPEVQRILRKCLEKDRNRRYQTMGDLVLDLEGVTRELELHTSRPPGSGPVQPPVAAGTGRRTRKTAVIAAAGLLLAGAAGTAAYLYWSASNRTTTVSAADFVQITALPDSASAPALSPDGRMVAFIRGDWFLDTGQIYIKLLPNGDAVKLTNDPRPKYGPTFTPDGSRVAYTVVDHAGMPSMSWDTWTVPVLGGQPTRLLPNAAGLTWIDNRHVLFSEIEAGTGLHMGIVTATEDRQGERRVYFPEHERAMAHFSQLSPDRHWVLVVEMDRTAVFQPCRLVPFDGSSSGHAVGPSGSCSAAAWSLDGRWMYFSVRVNGTSHLWRQRFPDGLPQPITSGSATEERGVALAPDGRSLVTSVGQVQGSLWFHDAGGSRPLSLEGAVAAPRLSPDAKRAYCLVSRVGDPSTDGLTRVDLASGKAERLLTEFSIADFDISNDEQSVAFTANDDRGNRQVWLAALDRRTPPRRITSSADSVRIGRGGELIYRSLTGRANFLERISPDGGNASRLLDRPIIDLVSVSPDGEWVVVHAPISTDPSAMETLAVPAHGGSARQLCGGTECGISWSPDGHSAYLHSFMFRLPPGQVLPGTVSTDAPGWVQLRNDQNSDVAAIAPGPDPSVYAFTKAEQRGNLFRVPLR